MQMQCLQTRDEPGGREHLRRDSRHPRSDRGPGHHRDPGLRQLNSWNIDHDVIIITNVDLLVLSIFL